MASRRTSFARIGCRVALVTACCTPLAASSCVTVSMWKELPDHHRDGDLDWRDGGTVAAVALTPVTVALDAALFVGWIWLSSQNGACGGDGFTVHFD